MVASVSLPRIKIYLVIHVIAILNDRFLLLLCGVPMGLSSRLLHALV